MKDYKIGYVTYNNEPIFGIDFFIEYIAHLNEKYQLDLNIIHINDYTKEICDLVLYTCASGIRGCHELYEQYKNRSFFKNAKGSPKFLLINWGEHRGFPEYGMKDEIYLSTFNNYVPNYNEYKCYSITMQKTTQYNYCIPYCIDAFFCTGLINSYNDILKNKKNTKTNFCSMIFSHGTYEREFIYNELAKYKKIDCFGNLYKNVENRYYGDEELNKLIPSYKFNICFENTHSEDNEFYVTEKLCNAFKWGTIPIYWGNNKQVYEIFNKDSFINLTDVPQHKWIDIIKEYDTNDDLYNNILNQNPILDSNIINKYFEDKEKFIVNILTNENN